MNIYYKNITLEIDRSEALDIYLALLIATDEAVKRHWKNYPAHFEECRSFRLLKRIAPYVDRTFQEQMDEWNALMGREVKRPG